MPRTVKSADTTVDSPGLHVWRGGRRIDLEKSDERFTVLSGSEDSMYRIRKLPGVREVSAVTRNVYKVKTVGRQRDRVMDAVRTAGLCDATHHAYKPLGSTGTTYYITDKITIEFKPYVAESVRKKLLARYALQHIKEYDARTVLARVTAESRANPVKIAARLAGEPLVRSAEPVMINRLRHCALPTDTYFKRQWHLRSVRGPELAADAGIDAPGAWAITTGKRSIVVAIIDDGFDLTHPDFKGKGKIVHPLDLVDGDTEPFPEGMEYHGTPCAGVAIAERNGKGVVGVAHGCAFMPVRFSHTSDDDQMIDLFEKTAKYADVISCSWSLPPVEAPLSKAVSRTLDRIVKKGGPRKRGCVICFAAGNDDAPVSDTKKGRTYQWRNDNRIETVTTPIINGYAAQPGVIAVTASTSQNRKALYSNWGKEICVCAPSDNAHPLDATVKLPGRGIWTTDNQSSGNGFSPRSRYTGEFGGTSSAAPLVAGVAALMLSANPDLTAAQVREILIATADKIVDKKPDAILGTNKGTYDAKGHSAWFGYGKVNAARAVKEAARRA